MALWIYTNLNADEHFSAESSIERHYPPCIGRQSHISCSCALETGPKTFNIKYRKFDFEEAGKFMFWMFTLLCSPTLEQAPLPPAQNTCWLGWLNGLFESCVANVLDCVCDILVNTRTFPLFPLVLWSHTRVLARALLPHWQPAPESERVSTTICTKRYDKPVSHDARLSFRLVFVTGWLGRIGWESARKLFHVVAQ